MEVWWWLFNLSYLSHVPERKILRSVKTFLCNKWVVTPKMVRNLIKRHQLSPAGIFVRVQTSVDCGTQHVAQFRYVTKSHHPPMCFLRLAGSISFFAISQGPHCIICRPVLVLEVICWRWGLGFSKSLSLYRAHDIAGELSTVESCVKTQPW